MGAKRRRRRHAPPSVAARPSWTARLKAFWLALIGRKPAAPSLASASASSTTGDASRLRGGARTDFEPTRVFRRPGDDEDEADWMPASRAAGAIEVTEEPMHTLPAELQDEFARPPSLRRPAPPPAAPAAAATPAAPATAVRNDER